MKGKNEYNVVTSNSNILMYYCQPLRPLWYKPNPNTKSFTYNIKQQRYFSILNYSFFKNENIVMIYNITIYIYGGRILEHLFILAKIPISHFHTSTIHYTVQYWSLPQIDYLSNRCRCFIVMVPLHLNSLTIECGTYTSIRKDILSKIHWKYLKT